MADNNITFLKENWEGNMEYLNWPGLQYLWYTKIKPSIYYSNSRVVKNRIDDENWYITYDASTGEVYITLNEDSSTFYFKDGSCGVIQQDNGMLQVAVNRDFSLMVDGFIDDNIGAIGKNSDQIGDATGKLYVNFDRNYEYESIQEDEIDI